MKYKVRWAPADVPNIRRGLRRLAGIVLLVAGLAACSDIYDVPTGGGSDEITVRIDAESSAWKRHATYSVSVSRFECGPQVLDHLPPDERARYGPEASGRETREDRWRPGQEPLTRGVTWPCVGSLFTEAHVRILFEAKRLPPQRPLDQLEIVSVSVPQPSRCDFTGPRHVSEEEVIQCDIHADPDGEAQGPQTITLVMGRLQDADLGFSVIATPVTASWIDGRPSGSANYPRATLGLERAAGSP